MKESDLKNLSNENLLDGIKMCQKNSVHLFSSAVDLASRKAYGIANSLLILSTEECMKCIVLMSKFLNIEGPSVDKFFKDHKTKHEEAAKIQPFLSVMSHLKTTFYRPKSKKRKRNRFLLIDYLVTAFLVVQDLKRIDDATFVKWWNNANKLKNDGFYVSYINKTWQSPVKITEQHYLESLYYTKPIVEFTEQIKLIKPSDSIEILGKKLR